MNEGLNTWYKQKYLFLDPSIFCILDRLIDQCLIDWTPVGTPWEQTFLHLTNDLMQTFNLLGWITVEV